MIWSGAIVPCRRISRRTVCSVMPPGSWWPRIGMPLIFAMSTALPEEWWDTLPELVKKPWPHLSEVTVGLRPDSAR